MELVVIMLAILFFFLTCILLEPVGRKWDSKEKRINYITGKNTTVPYQELELSMYKRFIYPKINAVTKILTKLGGRNKQSNNEQLERNLRLAGIKVSPAEFTSMKIIAMIVIMVTSTITAFAITREVTVNFLIILCGIIAAVLAPRYFLTSKIKSRQNKIRDDFPEIIDLLSVSMEAGLSFDAAILKISEKMKGPLVDEFVMLQREIQMGRPRREAFKSLADNSDISELKTFSSAMTQADQLGIPVNNLLKIQAEQLRMDRKQRAQEKGMKAPVKMILPMVVFIFPVIFIILLGPTVIQLIEQFAK